MKKLYYDISSCKYFLLLSVFFVRNNQYHNKHYYLNHHQYGLNFLNNLLSTILCHNIYFNTFVFSLLVKHINFLLANNEYVDSSLLVKYDLSI